MKLSILREQQLRVQLRRHPLRSRLTIARHSGSRLDYWDVDILHPDYPADDILKLMQTGQAYVEAGEHVRFIVHGTQTAARINDVFEDEEETKYSLAIDEPAPTNPAEEGG